jgi:4-hydroxybenzoate polyprenyltransferase
MTRLRTFLDMVRFEHTIFALPFAYIGMFLAAGGLPTLWDFAWITVAMAAARTLAFAVNRIADRHLDARNPRTANRPLVTGALSLRAALGYAAVALIVLLFAAALLDPLAVKLFPGALVFLIGYSYTKRFTVLAHWILGFTDGLAPIGAWLAVRGSVFALEDLPAWFLLFAVTFWIGGFDLIYATQDTDFDIDEDLHAWPARYGLASALRMARASHVITVILLAGAGLTAGLGWPYWVGLAAVAALLTYEHSLVSSDDLSKVNIAFFNVNGIISIVISAATLAALLLT